MQAPTNNILLTALSMAAVANEKPYQRNTCRCSAAQSAQHAANRLRNFAVESGDCAKNLN